MAINPLTSNHPGLPFDKQRTSAASAASPFVTTFQLPSPGVFLIVARGKANGSSEHTAVSTWLVYWSGDITNDLISSQQLGSTVKSTGSALAGDTLLSAPSATGLVSITASWLGGNNTCIVDVECRKISTF